MLKPNKFGRYKKDDIINNGYEIIDYDTYDNLVTASMAKTLLQQMLTPEQRLELCKGFICSKELRGCVPLFDLNELIQMKYRGEI